MIVIRKKHLIIFFILFAVLFPQCDKVKNPDCAMAICTTEFRGIGIMIKHSADSSAVLLTDYKVHRVSDNMDITKSNYSYNDKSGYYPLVTDSDLTMLKNQNVEIEFQGFINGTLVITQRFVVTADCCHVSPLSGESVFYI
jgi:hypothetical protein